MIAAGISKENSDQYEGASVTGSIVFWLLISSAVLGFVLLIFQWYAEYRRRTYDPTWAIELDDRFNCREMRVVRAKAARELVSSQGRLRDSTVRLHSLDMVLDFFEDLGFYLIGDQVTPEVAHHGFYFWLRGYYSVARSYIEQTQAGDATMWERVAPLFDVLHEVELERSKGKAQKYFDGSGIDEFLSEEVAQDSSIH